MISKFKHVLIICVLTGILSTAFSADTGGIGGSGGDGYALLFTQMGYRIHRELLTEEFNVNHLQVRDEMSLTKFYETLNGTKVIFSDDKLFDKHGNEMTALYFTAEELEADYKSKDFSAESITKILKDLSYGLIKVNRNRFLNELSSGVHIALGTVFHEYARAMNLPEDNYKTIARNYDEEFFKTIENKASSLSKDIFVEAQNIAKSNYTKLEIINNEKLRVKKEILEDSDTLKEALQQRRPMVEDQRRAFSASINYKVNGQDKLSRLQVMNLQVDFMTENIKRNIEFYREIDSKREEIFWEIINK